MAPRFILDIVDQFGFDLMYDDLLLNQTKQTQSILIDINIGGNIYVLRRQLSNESDIIFLTLELDLAWYKMQQCLEGRRRQQKSHRQT